MKKICCIHSNYYCYQAGGTYFYIRFVLLKAKDFKPDYSKSKSIIDMRPAIIAKLQQLVKDGSDGLYYLSIGKMDLHILASSIDITNAVLTPDSARIKELDKAHTLPDDLFKISFSSLHIDGLGLNDVLSKDHLLLKRILITSPLLKYIINEKGTIRSAYKKKVILPRCIKKIMKKMKSISIDTIEVLDGAFISHLFSKKYQTNKLNDVSIIMNDVLIDSSTQYDTKRFLFAKQANLSTKNFYGRTPDSLYYFKCSSIDISTTGNNLTALNIELHPRENRQQFESHLKQRKEIYNLTIPKITVSGINWWDLANQKNIIANEATISNASCDIFLDRSLPFRKVKVNNFPHQILMRLPVPLSITKMHIRHCNLAYSEHNPGMDKTGTVYIDDMNGEVTNITNMQAQIKKHKILVIKSSGLFMHKIPMTNGFTFNLSKYKTGDFTMDLNIGAIDSSILNPITEPMGEFMIQKGTYKKELLMLQAIILKVAAKENYYIKIFTWLALKKIRINPGA